MEPEPIASAAIASAQSGLQSADRSVAGAGAGVGIAPSGQQSAAHTKQLSSCSSASNSSTTTATLRLDASPRLSDIDSPFDTRRRQQASSSRQHDPVSAAAAADRAAAIRTHNPHSHPHTHDLFIAAVHMRLGRSADEQLQHPAVGHRPEDPLDKVNDVTPNRRPLVPPARPTHQPTNAPAVSARYTNTASLMVQRDTAASSPRNHLTTTSQLPQPQQSELRKRSSKTPLSQSQKQHRSRTAMSGNSNEKFEVGANTSPHTSPSRCGDLLACSPVALHSSKSSKPKRSNRHHQKGLLFGSQYTTRWRSLSADSVVDAIPVSVSRSFPLCSVPVPNFWS